MSGGPITGLVGSVVGEGLGVGLDGLGLGELGRGELEVGEGLGVVLVGGVAVGDGLGADVLVGVGSGVPVRWGCGVWVFVGADECGFAGAVFGDGEPVERCVVVVALWWTTWC
jgi:hypothetical protein